MPVSNVHALHCSLQSMMAQGLEQRYAAYQAAARAVRRGLEALGFPLLVKDDAYASPLTTAFYMRPGVDPAALQTALIEEAKVKVSVGIGALHDEILRVGHIGLARKRDYVVAFLLGVEDYLQGQGLAVPAGQSLVALEGLEV
jgi:aspartate aminotransferase-like enzyme